MSDTIVTVYDLDKRHHGLTPAIASSYAEGAAVCLQRHHSPVCGWIVKDSVMDLTLLLNWDTPDARTLLAWNNHDETTEMGAYAIALVSVEHAAGLVAIGRAQNRSGADYYVGPQGSDPNDFENAFRLEVSGTDNGDRTTIARRLKAKAQQTRDGDSNLPAIAAVVGFKAATTEYCHVDPA